MFIGKERLGPELASVVNPHVRRRIGSLLLLVVKNLIPLAIREIVKACLPHMDSRQLEIGPTAGKGLDVGCGEEGRKGELGLGRGHLALADHAL